jgi:hypothetical protein
MAMNIRSARCFIKAVYRKKKYAELCVKNMIERNKERGDSTLYWYEVHAIREPDKIEDFF